jgi:hypothetical protein
MCDAFQNGCEQQWHEFVLSQFLTNHAGSCSGLPIAPEP